MNSQTSAAPDRKRAGSLRVRLFWTTVGGIALALLLSGLALTTLFRDHVVNQFQAALTRQLDQLLVTLEFDETGHPEVDATALFDPRLQKQYSGFYWQIDEFPDAGSPVIGILRSRSLWDANLSLPFDNHTPPPGELAVSETVGPAGESLLVLQRIVSSPDSPGRHYRLIVAGNLRFNLEATERFGRALALAEIFLLLLLTLSAWAQVTIGLKPLKALQQALKSVRDGAPQMAGRFPQEVQPLVDDFNQVLAANATAVQRARTQAGNLAHALKTPLTILENEADQAQTRHGSIPPEIIKEQLAQIRRHIDWHLMRARVAAVHGLSAQQTNVTETVSGLLRVLDRVFADKPIQVSMQAPSQPIWFAGEEQDLQEIVGNLLENAFKWSHSSITVTLSMRPQAPDWLEILIEDNGPGIAVSRLKAVTQRGVRLDENTPGSGLGLAIVQDLIQLYGGEFELKNLNGDQGGLRARVCLPGARVNRA
ncbi:ATP-binding protein [Brenneria roseae subsp. americana]|uniref:histidine kinase n=1 Tax=Brenneria roseae subsp. americana TaxID=1508507 RepID=A0A2U1TSK1_9GAMM|nr:sensor histidine kinase [Brenneria roseae]PWC12376.1 ATP-binding protein [Brenneria roseae subsp. americana]